MSSSIQAQYAYGDARPGHHHAYLLPHVDAVLHHLAPRTVFDLGCGNGSIAAHLSKRYSVTGVDASASGIDHARTAFPQGAL